MHMKKWIFLYLALTGLAACHDRKNLPDLSHISVSVTIERFDKAFFAIDTNQVEAGLRKLNEQFPYFFTDFTANILGVGVLTDTSRTAFALTRQFLTTYLPVKDSIEYRFEKLDGLEKELARDFRFVKYYFPSYALPKKVVTYIGPFDAPGVAITPYALAIGLQLYAGRQFSFYNSLQGQEMYPGYISRRFEPEYIPVNCIKAIGEDLFADKSQGKPLIDQMIEKGKSWYLTDLLLPETPDSLKTGFTGKQLAWCQGNEGLIWNYFLQPGTDLYTIDPDIIKNYIGESPSTAGMPDASPGNIGQWVGWRIVRSYMEKNPGTSITDLMKTDPRKIFQGAGYKPR